ncbi:protein kinase [Sorangium cellulosum]|uniref:non-specific serine/threonine protein kinase n=1 Tax=Sorangium cellulosum TaxID=56 RepID=A0A4V0NCR5_SORCE|nr:serine/threonine-protein kinase [Sorangium cellulosum]AUX20092.1 protein kinase [Sorangium cellulosum]
MSANENVVDDVARSEPIDPLLGKVLNGKFKILSMLATGGMGTIYRGEQIPLGRPVAIKVLIPNQASRQLDPNFHKRFFLEASILARLQHPNIVTVFDYGKIEADDQERYFMAMEFLEGETLFRRVRRQGRLPPPEAMRIARQIARGLREAHKHGVVHRDLKPSNIMLVSNEDAEEAVKILDFGLVKQLGDDSEELTQQGAFLGSPRFMSPEQISHGKVDLRTDIYSLGVILYQMLCGKVPFESEKSIQILMAHLQQPVPRMKERNPDIDIPEPLEALVMRCLAKDPDGRPATMDALIQGLGECARGMGVATAFGSTQITSFESLPGVQISSRSSTMQALKEAVTLPAPTDDEASGRTSGVGTSLGAATTSATDAKGGAGAQDARPGSGKKTAILAAVGAVVVAGLAFVFTRSPAEPPPTPVAAADPAPTSAPAALPSDNKGSSTFVLILDSIPSGADVLEDGKSLGQTPLQLSIENEKVRDAPRRLTVQKEGFQPYSVAQGPSDVSVRLVAPLVQTAAPEKEKEKEKEKEEPTSSKRPTWTVRRAPPPPPPATTSVKPKEPPPPIIRNER